MRKVDITIEVCGMAGDGTIAAGGLINEAMSLGGFSVLGFDSYPAEIRGFGRCVTHTRIGSDGILALTGKTQVLISLDNEQSISRVPFLADNAAVIFDNQPPVYVEESRSLTAKLEPGMALFGMPLSDLASEAAGTTRGRNLTALGGFVAIFGASLDLFRKAVVDKFGSKGKNVLDANLKSFEAGFAYASEHFEERIRPMFGVLEQLPALKRVIISGNQAIGKAALDAGLKLYFGYPITPATPIM